MKALDQTFMACKVSVPSNATLAPKRGLAWRIGTPVNSPACIADHWFLRGSSLILTSLACTPVNLMLALLPNRGDSTAKMLGQGKC